MNSGFYITNQMGVSTTPIMDSRSTTHHYSYRVQTDKSPLTLVKVVEPDAINICRTLL